VKCRPAGWGLDSLFTLYSSLFTLHPAMCRPAGLSLSVMCARGPTLTYGVRGSVALRAGELTAGVRAPTLTCGVRGSVALRAGDWICAACVASTLTCGVRGSIALRAGDSIRSSLFTLHFCVKKQAITRKKCKSAHTSSSHMFHQKPMGPRWMRFARGLQDPAILTAGITGPSFLGGTWAWTIVARHDAETFVSGRKIVKCSIMGGSRL
jgi:hypothetical protein